MSLGSTGVVVVIAAALLEGDGVTTEAGGGKTSSIRLVSEDSRELVRRVVTRGELGSSRMCPAEGDDDQSKADDSHFSPREGCLE